MNRSTVLRKAARYAEHYSLSQEAIRNQAGASQAQKVRTALLNMADEDAAAPDLLDACKLWLTAVQESMSLRLALIDLPEGAGPALVEIFQEAVAKAEGQAGGV
jgi:hypothetical protein